MTQLSLHLWDRPRAFAELRRVVTGRAVLATFDPAHFGGFWLNAFFPSIERIDLARFPDGETLERELRAAGFAEAAARAAQPARRDLARGGAGEDPRPPHLDLRPARRGRDRRGHGAGRARAAGAGRLRGSSGSSPWPRDPRSASASRPSASASVPSMPRPDATAMLAVYGDPEVMRFIPGGALAGLEAVRSTLETYAREQESRGFSFWAVVERETGHVIGDVGFGIFEPTGELELGWTLARDRWGHGYGAEVAAACLASRARASRRGPDRRARGRGERSVAPCRRADRDGEGGDDRSARPPARPLRRRAVTPTGPDQTHKPSLVRPRHELSPPKQRRQSPL